jgi:transposase, IS30 family
MPNYHHLNVQERSQLHFLLTNQKLSLRRCAQQMGRSTATLSRELQRNRIGDACYQVESAQRVALGRRRRDSTRRKLQPGNALWDLVVERLRCAWSPEQIATCLTREASHPSVSHETIYKAIYALPKGELKTELTRLLRQSHKTRRPRAAGTKRGDVLKNITPISARPADVADRAIPGHWEADLIKGAGNRSAVATLVERTTRFTILAKLPDAKATSVLEALTNAMQGLPTDMLRSLTYDRGREMALHDVLAERLQIQIFFADPYSPWQRGTNENTNGLIRQYLPKGTDLSVHSQDYLNQIAHALNQRPRAALDFITPLQAFAEVANAHPADFGVALRG